MIEFFLVLGIFSVIISGFWSLISYKKLLRKDVECGSVYFEVASVVRIVPTVLILCNLIFVLPLPIRLVFTNSIEGGISENLDIFINYFPLALFLNSLFIFLFTIVFCWKVRASRKKICSAYVNVKKRWSNMKIILVAVPWLGVSIFLMSMLAQKSGGSILSLVLQGYAVTENFNNNGIYAIGLTWFSIFPVFLLACENGSKRISVIFFFSIFLIIVNAMALIFMGRRGELVFIGLSLLIIWNYRFNILNKKKLFLILIVGFFSMNILGMIRGQSYSSISSAVDVMSELVRERSSDGLQSYTYTLTTGQFAVPFSSFPEIISHMGDEVPYWWGRASIGSIALIIPNAIWLDRPPVLSNWYMREFYDSEAASNVGRQFFILNAPYMDYGIFGLILFGLFFGYFVARCAIFLSTRLSDPTYMTLLALSVGYGLSWMSNDIVGGLIAFLKITLPLFIIMFFEFLFRLNSRENKIYKIEGENA